jgi:hypothetical protein
MDSCVHPDFQDEGVYSRFYTITGTEDDDFDFRFRSAINQRVLAKVNQHRPHYLEFGSRLKALVRAVSSSHRLADHYLPAARTGLQRRILSAAISTARVLGAIQWSSAPVNNRLEIRPIQDREEILSLFESLLNRIPRPSGLFQERTRDYVRWRYCDIRGGRSIVLFAFENSEPAGVAVGKISEGIGSLMDLLTDPGRQDVASELVGAVDGLLKREGAAAVVCRVLENAPLYKTLRAHHYIPSPLKTGCQLSPAVLSLEELKMLLKGRDHHLMMSDFDWA